jgi:hypothetical protein
MRPPFLASAHSVGLLINGWVTGCERCFFALYVIDHSLLDITCLLFACVRMMLCCKFRNRNCVALTSQDGVSEEIWGLATLADSALAYDMQARVQPHHVRSTATAVCIPTKRDPTGVYGKRPSGKACF